MQRDDAWMSSDEPTTGLAQDFLLPEATQQLLVFVVWQGSSRAGRAMKRTEAVALNGRLEQGQQAEKGYPTPCV